LFLGTVADNQRDMATKGRAAQGVRNGSARLTEDDVRTIRARYTGKRGDMTRIGREYGMGSGSVSRILSGKRWGHLP
jgi:hypothetical protein